MSTPIRQAINDARAKGLVRRGIDNTPRAANMESVYLSFAQFGTPTVGGILTFAPNSPLDGQNSTIKAIEVVDSTTNNLIPGKAVDPLAPSVLAQGMFYAMDYENAVIFSIPLTIMIRRLNSGKYVETELNTQRWQNCGVVFNDVSSLSTSNGLWFNIFYDPK